MIVCYSYVTVIATVTVPCCSMKVSTQIPMYITIHYEYLMVCPLVRMLRCALNPNRNRTSDVVIFTPV